MSYSQPRRRKKRSLASELRYKKVYEAEVPKTRLLDTRNAFTLTPVTDPKKKVLQARQKAAGKPIQEVIVEKEIKESIIDPPVVKQVLEELEDAMANMGPSRDPAETNPTLIGEHSIYKFVKGMNDTQREDAAQRVRSRIGLIVEALRRKCSEVHKAMDRKGVFHTTANRKRSETILQVELRKLRLDVIEADVLEEMHYESNIDSKDSNNDAAPFNANEHLKTVRHRWPTSKPIVMPPPDEVENRWKQQTAGFANHIRTRALGTAVTHRPLVFRKVRKSRTLGTFLSTLTEEERIAKAKPWRSNFEKRKDKTQTLVDENVVGDKSNTKLEIVDSTHNRDSNDQMIDNDETVNDSSQENSSKKSTTTKTGMKTPNRARVKPSYQSAIEQIWKTLEVPMIQKLTYLVKYSNPELAPYLGESVTNLGIASEMISSRETLLRMIIQSNPEQRNGLEIDENTMKTLEEQNCFISSLDTFGVPTFIRFAQIVCKLSAKLKLFLEDIQTDLGDVVTFRGGSYLKVLKDSVGFENKWMNTEKLDWRKVGIPPLCIYHTNPTLRRYGTRVAT